ncbi:MAG: tetratricopeptide repeat protein [Candidatus Odinarchaeota archaeon]
MGQNDEAIKRLNITGTSKKSSVEIRKLPNKRYEFIFFADGQRIFHKKTFGGSPDNDKLVDMLAASGLDFISFSAMGTTANEIETVTRAMELLDVVADEYTEDDESSIPFMQETPVKTIEEEKSDKLDELLTSTSVTPMEDGTARIKLPMSAGAVVEIRLLGKQKVELNFYQDSIKIYSQTLKNPDNETLLDLLATSGVEFSSLSGISHAADDLEKKIVELRTTGKEQEIVIPKKEKKVSEARTVDDLLAIDEEKEEQETAAESLGETLVPTEPVEEGTFLTDVKVPYSPSSLISVYQVGKEFKLIFKEDGRTLSFAEVKSEMDEDELTVIISNSGMNFIGMTVILDCAEAVLGVIKKPEQYFSSEIIDEERLEDHEVTLEEPVTKEEEELDLNLDEYRTPADIENLIIALKKSVDQNKPTLMKEIEIKIKTKGVTAKIFRQGESTWFFQIFQKKEAISNMMKLNSVDQDEVFRVLNNGVPQTSLSELASAAEEAYSELGILASQSQDDLILTQVVNHFNKVIESHENNNELDQARELSKSLLEKFKKLNNAEGISKFGQKTAAYYESQGRLAESAQLRVDLVDYLLENLQHLHEAKEFVDITLDFLVNAPLNRYLDAAELCIKFADTCIERDETLLGVDYVKRSTAFYKNADLPVALTDACFKYGKLFLDLVFESKVKEEEEEKIEEEEEKIEEESEQEPSRREKFLYGGGFSGAIKKKRVEKKDTKKKGRQKATFDPKAEEKKQQERKEKIIAGAVELFRTALEVHETRKDKFELIEGVTNVILWMREQELVEEEIFFSEKAINYFDDFGQDKRSLKLSLQLVPKLFNAANTEMYYPKALELTNKVIRTYMENPKLKNMEKAVEFSIENIENLIQLKQRDAAVGYLNFARDLIPRAFNTEDKLDQKLKYIMRLSSSFQQLHMAEDSLAEIKKGLEIKKNQGADEFLDFVRDQSKEYLSKELLQSAHDLVNTAITLVGSTDLSTVIKLSNNFAEDLFPSKNHKLALDYITYAYTQSRSLHNADPHDAINMIVHFTMLFLEDPEVKNVTEYVNQLVPVFIQFYQYTGEADDAIPALTKIIDHLIEKKEYVDAARYTKDLGGFYGDKKKYKEAVSSLINYRDKFITRAINEAKEITDIALDWCVNQLKDTKTAIAATEALTVELIKKDQFEDAYIYTIQCSKYYEMTDDIEGAAGFLSRIKEAYGDNIEFSERIADFNIRLNRGHKRTQEAIDLAISYFHEFLGRQKADKAVKFLDDSIKLLISEKRPQEALEILKDVEGTLMGQKSPEVELIVEREAKIIKEWKEKYKEWKADEKIRELLIQSANECYDIGLIEVADRLMSRCVIHVKNTGSIDNLIPILENWIEKLSNKEEYERSRVYVIEIVNYALRTEEPGAAQETVFKYITSYLDQGQVNLAIDLIEGVIERHKKDTAQIIKNTFRFVKKLTERGLISNARVYIEKSIDSFTKPAASREEIFAAGKFCEKFAELVMEESPALALEYVYKAGDFYKRNQDIDSLVNLYKDISKQIGKKTGLKIIKRGLFLVESMTIDSNKLFELHQVHVKLLIESKERESRIKIGIQKLLEVTESLDSLDTLASVVNELVIDLAKGSMFDIIMVYFEYLINLVRMVGKSNGLKTVFRVTKNHFQTIGKEEFIKKIDEAYENLPESEPEELEVETFLLTEEEKKRFISQKIEERRQKEEEKIRQKEEEISEEQKEIMEEEEIEKEIVSRTETTELQEEDSGLSEQTSEALSSLLELEDSGEEYKSKVKKSLEIDDEIEDEDFEIKLIGGSLKELAGGPRKDIQSLLEPDSEDDVEDEERGPISGSLKDLVGDISAGEKSINGTRSEKKSLGKEESYETSTSFLDVRKIVRRVTSPEENIGEEHVSEETTTRQEGITTEKDDTSQELVPGPDEEEELSVSLIQPETTEQEGIYKAIDEDEEGFDSEFASIIPSEKEEAFSAALKDLEELDIGKEEEKKKKKKND